MVQYNFGIGALWGQRQDVGGIGPDQFAVLQDNTVEFGFEIKELYSQYEFPSDIARGKGKITGKAKSARIFAQLYSDLFFGVTAAVGSETISQDEAQTIPAVSAFIITVANAATFIGDLGVFFATGLQRLTYTSGAPTVSGQYTVNLSTGVYTFNSADANKAVRISYVFNQSAVGKSIPIVNNFMGFTPNFQATFYNQRTTFGSSGSLTMILFSCVSNRLTFPSRIDDYNLPEFDWMAFANSSNNIGNIYTTE